MGISIVWYELEAGTLARWREQPAGFVERLRAANHFVFEGPDAVPPSPPILRVSEFDYKARVHGADAHSSEAGDQVHAAIQGDLPFDLGPWPPGYLRAYSRAHLLDMVASLPDDPDHPGHDLRTHLAELLDRGTELLSLWT